MSKTTWVILGATSIIAEAFAQHAAQEGHPLLLVARNTSQLDIIAADIRLRYGVDCETQYCDFSQDSTHFITSLMDKSRELALFIAFSNIVENDQLTTQTIASLIKVNILSTTQIIHSYLQKAQKEQRIIFLSSVAASRGRAKNSLYGGSKAAIDVYLQGLQQAALPNQHFTIARLGFIDTEQTFGAAGIFYASPAQSCAKACWRASYANKRKIYHPFFWRVIMSVISYLPFTIFRRLKA